MKLQITTSGEGEARSAERILLDEANHRVANEASVAIAAMRIARSAKGARSRDRLLDVAIGRLEGFGACCRILSGPAQGDVDVGDVLERLCRSLLQSRVGHVPDSVVLDLDTTIAGGELAHRVALITNEIITNALKHAFDSGGLLEVRLRNLQHSIEVTVRDDGPGFRAGRAGLTSGTRFGAGLISELVRGASGTLDCKSGAGGTRITFALPRPHGAHQYRPA